MDARSRAIPFPSIARGDPTQIIEITVPPSVTAVRVVVQFYGCARGASVRAFRGKRTALRLLP